ncbi:uncharacterized protein LOC143258248 [Tachypleus tridentatus]|uniref:uncharacterized protein LOC143258248 n=1 Tax=Tachypleus tridentatus TaxID=6853 RepID=UPI003FD5CE11
MIMKYRIQCLFLFPFLLTFLLYVLLIFHNPVRMWRIPHWNKITSYGYDVLTQETKENLSYVLPMSYGSEVSGDEGGSLLELDTMNSTKKSENRASVTENPHVTGWVNRWIHISPNIHVYSAYFDNRSIRGTKIPQLPLVRIFGRQDRGIPRPPNVQCLLSVNRKNFSRTDVTGDLWKKMESTVIINCQHHEFSHVVPKWVTVVEHGIPMSPTTWIPVHNNPQHDYRHRRGKIVMCVQPLRGPYDNFQQLAESIGFYSVLGVSHFVFYEHQTTSKVKNILQKIISSGVSIEINPWDITWPIPQYGFMGDRYAQLTQLQDCTYKNQYQYEYIVNVDTDEFIVPLKYENLLEMMKNISKLNSKSDYFRFPHVFVCKNRIPAVRPFKAFESFSILQSAMRTPIPSNWTWYQKTIYRPEKVVYTRQHRSIWLISGSLSTNVNDEALVFHVKFCTKTIYQKATIEDDTIPKRFGTKIKRILQQWFP